MLGRRDDEPVELECPVCGTEFKATESEAAKGKVRCPQRPRVRRHGDARRPGRPWRPDDGSA